MTRALGGGKNEAASLQEARKEKTLSSHPTHGEEKRGDRLPFVKRPVIGKVGSDSSLPAEKGRRVHSSLEEKENALLPRRTTEKK